MDSKQSSQIQEAGLSFYSYVILSLVLRSRPRWIFLSLFWTLMAVITAIRLVILTTRIRYILAGPLDPDTAILQKLVDQLHVGYFVTIAAAECTSSFFLLREFRRARKIRDTGQGLFSYLMRSSEIRLALLAVVGVTRAITYSYQNTAQSATTVASQVDRFAYSLECFFPIVMFIDIIASRLVFTDTVLGSGASSNLRANKKENEDRINQPRGQHILGDSMDDYDLDKFGNQVRIDVCPGTPRKTVSRNNNSSQECIVYGAES